MKYVFSIATLLLIINAAHAKPPKRHKLANYFKKAQLHASINNNAVSMPNVPINGSIHPGFTLGYAQAFKPFPWLKYGVDVGYFFQKGLQSGLSVSPTFSANSKIYKRLYLKYLITSGALLVKNYNPEFVKNTDGSYKKTSALHFQYIGGVGLEPQYNFYRSKKYEWFLGVRYQFNAQLPFSAISSLLPITQIQVTLTLKPYFLL
jgi:hypothetical protein